MTPGDVTFTEVLAERRTAETPLAQLSIEVGHLYAEDFDRGSTHLRTLFERVRPWLEALRAASLPGQSPKPRISTCFLVDDYFGRLGSPAEVLPGLLATADAAAVPIDYLARESACAGGRGAPVVELVVGRIVADPPPETNGYRPPPHEVGWLSNGQRSPNSDSPEALRSAGRWQPPRENSKANHSVFVDVELWSEGQDGHRTWSCPLLAAVWQLLRLGLLRNQGQPVIEPVPRSQLPERLPDRWAELPEVIQLTSRAAPFSAYRTASVLPTRFLPVELAVRTILSQVAVDPAVNALVAARSRGERVEIPPEVVDRISYVFLG